MERVATLIVHNLFVLIATMLYNKMYLILKAQQKQHGFLAGHSFHVHIVHLQYLIARLQTLGESWASWLHGGHENTDFVATRQSNADRSFFLERNEPWIGPVSSNKTTIIIN